MKPNSKRRKKERKGEKRMASHIGQGKQTTKKKTRRRKKKGRCNAQHLTSIDDYKEGKRKAHEKDEEKKSDKSSIIEILRFFAFFLVSGVMYNAV